MGSFFKPLKNRKFSYTPRYYDDRKERMEIRKNKIKDEDDTSVEARIKGKFKRVPKQQLPGILSGATLRSLIALGIIVLAVFYFLNKYKYYFNEFFEN